MTGVIVSAGNHDGSRFNWLQVREEGYEFALIKSTQGVMYLNPYCIADCRDACLSDLLVATWHYMDDSGSREEQQNHFERNGIAQVEQYCKLPPIYDIEQWLSVTSTVATLDTTVITGLGSKKCETLEGAIHALV